MNTSTIMVKGEVMTPGIVDLSMLYKHEIVLKEAVLDSSNEIEFIGAYRYIGYSLYDLLQPFVLNKKNAETFKPQIDLYIVIENDKGESVVFSWSEIFHTCNIHQVLIATESAPVKPHKVQVNYPVTQTWKVVAGNDLFSFRILENPTSITVYSFDKKEYPIDRTISPMFSSEVKVISDSKEIASIPVIQDKTQSIRYNTIFYGMGMGYHHNPYFEGLSLPELLKEQIRTADSERIRHGLVCFASVDGYRSVFSYSELFNRNDQVIPILAIPENHQDGGYYRNFLPTDFFADRSVKSLKEIYFFKP
jgi:hypothetical protein